MIMENWLKSAANKLKGAAKSAKNTVADWFTPDDKPEVRPGEFLREVPGAVGNVAKEIAKGVVRFPLSAGESIVSGPLDAYNAATGKGVKVPVYKPEVIPGLSFLGPIESYQNEVRRKVGEGGSAAGATGKAVLDVALDEPIGMAFKPLGLAMAGFMRGGGGKAAQEAIENIVKSTKESEIVKILESFNLGKKAAAEVAPDLAAATTREEVQAILSGAAKDTGPKPKVPRETKAPAAKPADAPVSRETESVGSMRSVGDIMKGEGGTPRIPVDAPAPKIKEPATPERRFVKRAGELEPNMQQYLDAKYKPRSNEELMETAKKQIDDDYAAAELKARNGTDDESVAIASRMIDDLITDARAAKPGTAQDALYEKAAQIANDAGKNLTEAGRAVQAASLLGRMTPEGMVRYAARQISKYNEQAGKRTLQNFLGSSKKIPNLSGEQAKDLTETMERINKMPDGIEKAKEIQKLQDSVREMIPDSLYNKIITLWKAGLLTGLKTSGLNILANVSHTGTEILKDVPAALVDRVVSLFTGKRTLAMTTKGELGGMKEGVAKGWEYFKTGFDERNVGAKLDYKKVNFGKSKFAKALQAYEEKVFQTIGAQDQPFYYGMKARSLYSQAIAAAKNEGLKGKAAKDFIEKLVAEPTDDMLKYATLDAETAVFQNKTALGTAARAIQKLPGGQIVLPFGKTPAAVATQMINYTPVGVANAIISNIGKGRFDQRLFSQAMGRGLTGTAGLAVGMALMGNKMMNLGYPTSQKEREQWKLEGRMPNSILINGKWRNIGILGPMGMVLVIGGHLRQGIDETGSFVGGLAQAAGGAGNALTEQSFLKGINQAIEAVNDPERGFNGFASSLAGSIVPTIVSDISRALDTTERRTTNPIQRTISRIPGLRTVLQPQIDTLGNRVATPNLFEVMADPTRPGNPSAPKDPLAKELRRLLDAGYNSTPTQLGGRNGFKSLSGEQNTLLQEMGGKYIYGQIKEAMQDRSYSRYDDEQKSKAIEDAVSDAKDEARAQMVLQVVKALPAAERKVKLLEMKDDGLLTQTVYDIYLSLSR